MPCLVLILRKDCVLADFILVYMVEKSSIYLMALQDVFLMHPRIILIASLFTLSSLWICVGLTARIASAYLTREPTANIRVPADALQSLLLPLFLLQLILYWLSCDVAYMISEF